MFEFRFAGANAPSGEDDVLSHAREDCWKADREVLRKEWDALVRLLRRLLRA